MCEPTTITVLLALAAAAQAQQAIKQKNAYEKIAYGQRKEHALDQMNQLRQREFQERAKAAQDIQTLTRQAREAGGAAKLSALESGASGQSVNLLLADFERAQLSNVGVTQSNLAAVTGQIHAQQRAAGRIEGPAIALGPLDSALGIAATGLEAYSAGKSAYDQSHPKPPVT